MKKNLLLSIGLLAILTACSKNGTSPNVSMNTTEQNLVGKWNLVLKSDTTYIYQNNSVSSWTLAETNTFVPPAYVEFRSDAATNWTNTFANAKIADDGRLGSTAPTYWFYDSTQQQLMLSTQPFNITLLTSNKLNFNWTNSTIINGAGTKVIYAYQFTR